MTNAEEQNTAASTTTVQTDQRRWNKIFACRSHATAEGVGSQDVLRRRPLETSSPSPPSTPWNAAPTPRRLWNITDRHQACGTHAVGTTPGRATGGGCASRRTPPLPARRLPRRRVDGSTPTIADEGRGRAVAGSRIERTVAAANPGATGSV
eukprot:TRINITY_DN15744_c0_g1_i1.p1 TRINITY_DN15744_c0_g1~~TRINITY_DN15744_c0_g1_i1.p1  ORF type:complete len:152 (+),score=10.23 TRINITY_DN15744_c0_g1_i1:1-456(+)